MACLLTVSKPLPKILDFSLCHVKSWAPEGYPAHHHSPQALGERGSSGAGDCTPLRPPRCVRVSSGSEHGVSGHAILYKKKKKIPRARKSSRKSCKSDCRADRIIWGGKIRILLLRHALLPGRCLPVPVIFCSTLMLLLKGPLKSLMTQIQPKSWNIPRRDIAVIGSVRSW